MPEIAAPPRWILFLLWPFKGESCYPQIEGDLSEEFQYQESKHGIAAARRWYCREIFRNLASLTFRWATIAAIFLPLFCVAFSSVNYPFGPFLLFLRPIIRWLLPRDLTTQILTFLLLSTSITGLAFAVICNALLRGHERMITLVFTGCYLGLSALWVIKYPISLTRFPRDPVAIGLLEPLLILAFIWMGSVWVDRHHCRQARVTPVSQ